MRLNTGWRWLKQRDPWVRWAIALWLAVVLVISARCALKPRQRTLYTTWAGAGRDWIIGRDLYRTSWEWHQDQFRYSPLVAVLFVPFSYLPEGVGGVVWRLLNAGVLLGGFACWLRAAAPRTTTPREQAALFLLMLPLSLGSLNNGQPNPLVIGLLLLAVAAIGRSRWNSAAVLVMLAIALKVYPIAVGLLLVAAYPRRFAPRLLLAVLAGLAVPLLCQRWDYVQEQYSLWFGRLGGDDRKTWPWHMAYRDLWLLLRVLGIRISPLTYTGLQVLAAAGAALLCVAGRQRGWDRPRLLLAVLALGSCWMTLLGPATESSTYALLAPVLAWAVLEATRAPWENWAISPAGHTPWPWATRWMPAAAWWLFVLTVLAGLPPGAPPSADPSLHPLAVVAQAVRQGHFPATNQVHALGLHPLAALLLTVAYLVGILRALLRAGPTAMPAAGAPPPAQAA
jgi:hypothetical protein